MQGNVSALLEQAARPRASPGARAMIEAMTRQELEPIDRQRGRRAGAPGRGADDLPTSPTHRAQRDRDRAAGTPARALHRTTTTRPCSRCCTRSVSSTPRPRRSGRRCWTRAATWRSERTMYRLLAARHGGGAGASRPADPPRLRAGRSCWPSVRTRCGRWDITKLQGAGEVDLLLPVRDPRRLQPLRRRLDRRSTARTRRSPKALIAQTCEQQQIAPGQLTVHADRGTRDDASKPVAFLLADLGVAKTHSRPYTSTDNPYSEAQFKTLKYRPEFPDRFEIDRAGPRVLPRRSSTGTTTSIATPGSA